MERRKEESIRHGLKDKEVPPVKGAVTDMEDIIRKPAGIFGPAHPAEPVNLGNAGVFDLLQ